ncbi:MAG: chemotaxis protein CheC [Candidatus Omnitrophota bacterium]
MQDELDILREVGSIISAHGSIALSKILGKRITISIPTTDFISSKTVLNKVSSSQIGIAVISSFVTGLKGRVVFLLDEKNAFKVVDMSYKIPAEEKQAGMLTEMGLSLIKEIGNIVIGAGTNALSMILRVAILTVPPTLISGSIEEILRIALFPAGEEGFSLLIEVAFEEPEGKIKGGFYLVLTSEAAADIKRICKELLNRL